jgi:putative membrane protein
MRFLVRLIFTAAALWVAVRLLEGITYEGSWAGLLVVAVVFGLVNAIIRPILYFLTCPFIAATLGLLVFVINAVMLLLTAAFSRSLGIDFRVEGFVDALVGAVIIGVVSAVLSVFVPDEDRRHARDR